MKILEFYKLWILLSPFLFFWLTYIFFFIKFGYYKLSNKNIILYFPEETKSLLLNFMFILPKRKAFLFLYYINLNSFTKKTVLHLLKIFAFIFLIGIPFVVCEVLWLYLFYRDFDKVWDNMTRYINIKLIFNNGKVIRNMKKLGHEASKFVDNFKTQNKIVSGLYKTEKNKHAVAYSEKTGIGVSNTSKKMNKKSNEEWLVRDDENSYAYAQKFDKSVKVTPEHLITNEGLRNVLRENKVPDVIKAAWKVSNTKEKYILVNKDNKQTWMSLTDWEKEKSHELLKKHGSDENIKEMINALDSVKLYKNVLDDGNDLCLKLDKIDKNMRHVYFSKYEIKYKALHAMKENKMLGKEDKEDIEKLISKIDELLL